MQIFIDSADPADIRKYYELGIIDGVTTYDEMLREARGLAQLNPNVYVKIPMLSEGIKVVKALAAEGIKTNVTLVFSPTQALLAAKAGAYFVSPFIGRIDDIASEGVDLIRERADKI